MLRLSISIWLIKRKNSIWYHNVVDIIRRCQYARFRLEERIVVTNTILRRLFPSNKTFARFVFRQLLAFPTVLFWWDPCCAVFVCFCFVCLVHNVVCVYITTKDEEAVLEPYAYLIHGGWKSFIMRVPDEC